MNIFVNGTKHTVPENSSLMDALEKFARQSPYVVMLNQEFIPKSQYAVWRLREADELEIIVAIQGG